MYQYGIIFYLFINFFLSMLYVSYKEKKNVMPLISFQLHYIINIIYYYYLISNNNQNILYKYSLFLSSNLYNIIYNILYTILFQKYQYNKYILY